MLRLAKVTRCEERGQNAVYKIWQAFANAEEWHDAGVRPSSSRQAIIAIIASNGIEWHQVWAGRGRGKDDGGLQSHNGGSKLKGHEAHVAMRHSQRWCVDGASRCLLS